MSAIAFPPDKESGSPIRPLADELHENDSGDDEQSPSTRQTTFLLALLWMAWLVAIVFDTMLEINRRYWSPNLMSPLQRYIWLKEWDVVIMEVSRTSNIRQGWQVGLRFKPG
jgi:hypothetical protein